MHAGGSLPSVIVCSRSNTTIGLDSEGRRAIHRFPASFRFDGRPELEVTRAYFVTTTVAVHEIATYKEVGQPKLFTDQQRSLVDVVDAIIQRRLSLLGA